MTRVATTTGARWPMVVVLVAGAFTTALNIALISPLVTAIAAEFGKSEAAAGQVQAGLCLHSGPLMRVVWLDLGPGRAGRLLVVIHHLAVDAVSWPILLEDLETAYRQAGRGEALRLPAKTTSFQTWAERLGAHAQSEAVDQELGYWRSVPAAGAVPVDHPDGVNTVGSARTVRVELG